jgi:hypothetical protein
MKQLRWSLEQNDAEVASGEGPHDFAFADALHYAAVYNQDGPVVLYEVRPRSKVLLLMATKGAMAGIAHHAQMAQAVRGD